MVRLVDVVAVQLPDRPEGGHAGRKHASRHPKRVGLHAGAVKEKARRAVCAVPFFVGLPPGRRPANRSARPPAARKGLAGAQSSEQQTLMAHPVACNFGGGSPGLAPLAEITVPRSGGAARRQGGAALSVKLLSNGERRREKISWNGFAQPAARGELHNKGGNPVAAPQTRCKPGRGLNAGGQGRRPAGRGVESAKIAVPARRIRSFPYPRKKFGTLESCPHFETLRTAHAARRGFDARLRRTAQRRQRP